MWFIKRIKRINRKIFYLLSLTILLIIIFGSWVYVSRYNKIHDGVYIGNRNLGGYNKAQARKIIKSYLDNKITNGKISLVVGDTSKKIKVSSYFKGYDIDSAVNDAFNYKRDQNLFYGLIVDASKQKEKYINVDFNLNNKNIEKLNKSLTKKPTNATIKTNGNFNYTIVNEEKGVKINKGNLIESLKKGVRNNKKTIKVKCDFLKPKINSYLLRYYLFKDELNTFKTEFDQEDESRVKNLINAAKKINGTMIKSGGIFSFEKVVGAITAKNGFKEAKVYQDGMIAIGLGGGICQIASTVHNSVIRVPELEILERKNHNFTVAYVEPGFDAAISTESDINYSFKNNSQYPVKVVANIIGNELKVTIKGTKLNNNRVKFLTKDIEKIPYITVNKDSMELDPDVKYVQSEPKDGLVVDTYRIIYRNNSIIENKKLYRSEYNPLNKIIFD